MNYLKRAEEAVTKAEKLVDNLKWDYKHGRATIFELERALIALERASHKYDLALLKGLEVRDFSEFIE